jgi:GalNAc-alpha-(1->4)-GalNAc-alpha-(1->3)-diNAcBac-PP-undecaprenol alpha-1,4-N-acetyl-D-galactosaminyltransferase
LSSQSAFSEKPLPGRIELVIHGLSGGGSERQMACLANHLAKKSQVRLTTLATASADRYRLDARVERQGLGLVSTKGGWLRGPLGNWQRVQALRRDAKGWKPQVAVSFCDTTNILSLAALASSIPVVISERSDPRKQKLSLLWEMLRRLQYPRAARCVVQTDDLKEHFQRTLFRKVPSKVITIPSAIEVPHLDVDRWIQERAKRDRFICLYMGRFSPEKRIDRILHAWSQLAAKHTNWSLKLVGDGPERSRLRAFADATIPAGSVHWTPWTTDAWTEWQQADLFTLTSDYEGFPQSVLEGMTAGLPSVVMNCSPALQTLYKDSRTGLLVASEAELVSGLDRLMSSERERQSMGLEARRAADPYHWPKVAPKWEAVISPQ